MGVQAPKGLIAIATNMACAIPPEIDAAAFAGAAAPPASTKRRSTRSTTSRSSTSTASATRWRWGTGRRRCTGSTILRIALAAWIIDHDIWTYRQIARVFDGVAEGLTRDDICDNITLYWLTQTGVSSARLYWENKLPFFSPKGVKIPVVVSAFPEEICPATRKWCEKAYPRLIYYKRHATGAHFARVGAAAGDRRRLRAGSGRCVAAPSSVGELRATTSQ
jgi:hypothetical protein